MESPPVIFKTILEYKDEMDKRRKELNKGGAP